MAIEDRYQNARATRQHSSEGMRFDGGSKRTQKKVFNKIKK